MIILAENKNEKMVQKINDLAKEIGIGGIIILQPFPVSAYNFENVSVKKQHPILAQKPFCEHNFQSVDLSGSSSTDANGKKTWRLSDHMCLPEYESWYALAGPVSFVATPVTDKPTYITNTVKIQSSPKDLIVEVYSWDKQGNPSPNMVFCWRCRLLYPTVIL